MCDLEAAQMNVQHSLIQELMLYESEVANNSVEAMKIFVKWKVMVQLITEE